MKPLLASPRRQGQRDWMIMTSVLVAVVGVVGTAAGALLAAIIAARTENRRQAALERQQLRQELIQRDDQIRELRIEHLRWRRER